MKYLKSFENIVLTASNTIYNIGDYVILQDTYNKIDKLSLWNNHYGVIIDICVTLDRKIKNLLYLVHIISNIEPKMKEFINISIDVIKNSDKDIIKPDIDYEDCIFVASDYLIKYDTKEEFDEAVKRIEIEKTSNKYNL